MGPQPNKQLFDKIKVSTRENNLTNSIVVQVFQINNDINDWCYNSTGSYVVFHATKK